MCAYRAELSRTADDWLWAEESPIYKLGGFEQFEPEARRIVIESLIRYPIMNVKTALTAAVEQFADIATGDGLTPWSWYTQWTFERFAPRALERYAVSRQVQAPFDFSWANFIHIPVQGAAIAAMLVIIYRGRGRRIAAFAALLLLALIGNAVICGALSNPHDRYQSRLAWLAPLIVTVAALGWRREFSAAVGIAASEEAERPAAA